MSKHNGINATREALKDQLVLAANAKIHDRIAHEMAMNFMRARVKRRMTWALRWRLLQVESQLAWDGLSRWARELRS